MRARAAEGSSKSYKSGSSIKARSIANIWYFPPDSLPARLGRRCSKRGTWSKYDVYPLLKGLF